MEFETEEIKHAIERYNQDKHIPEKFFESTGIEMSMFIQALIDYAALNYITPELALEFLRDFHQIRENRI